MSGFIAPVLNYAILAPIIVALAGAVIGVLVEAFASRSKRASLQLVITLATLFGSLFFVLVNRGKEVTDAAGGSVTFDGSWIFNSAGYFDYCNSRNSTFSR